MGCSRSQLTIEVCFSGNSLTFSSFNFPRLVSYNVKYMQARRIDLKINFKVKLMVSVKVFNRTCIEQKRVE